MKKLTPFLLLGVLVLNVGSRTTGPLDANDPALAKFFVAPSEKVMKEVGVRFEVIRRTDHGFEILVPAHRAQELYDLVPNAELLEADISETLRNLPPSHLRGYHDFSTVQEHLNRVVAQYPTLASLETYGKSKEGRPLLALRISNPKPQTKPAVMITSATHGNELITVEVVFGFVDALLSGYGKDSRLTQIVDEKELYFIPVVNPDGYIRKSRYANGIDPNRDYPYPDQPNRHPNECIAGVMSFFHSHNIKGSIDFHAYAELIMYPWAYTMSAVPAADETNFEKVAHNMAAANGYGTGQISKIMYVAQGSSADYYYWKNKTLAYGIEVARDFAPEASQIPGEVKANWESTLRFIEAVQ